MSDEGTQAIRTWKLKASSQSYEQCAPYLEPGPTLAAGERVEVIEREPVLDLLERLTSYPADWPEIGSPPKFAEIRRRQMYQQAAHDEAMALLQEYRPS